MRTETEGEGGDERYNEILFMVDTCQANTLYTKFYSPNILATGSSAKGENSYSHHADNDIGVAVTDRYTHHVLTFLESINKTSTVTLENLVRLSPPLPFAPRPRRLTFFPPPSPTKSKSNSKYPLLGPTPKFDTFTPELFDSHAGVRSDLFPRALSDTLLTDFFGGVSEVEITRPPPSLPVSSSFDSHPPDPASPGSNSDSEDGTGEASAGVRRRRRNSKSYAQRMRESKRLGEQGGVRKAVVVSGVLGALQVAGVLAVRSRSA